MKKLVLSLIVLALFACGSSKKKVESPGNNSSLEQRLAEFMKLNDEMNLEKIMDYIYPKLFIIVPRKELLTAMKEGFDNGEVKIELDSLKVNKLHPVFEMDKGSFAKVNYSMVMLMNLTSKEGETGDDPAAKYTYMKQVMAEKYGEENVSLDEATGIIKIRSSSPMVAVKDEYAKEWSFVSLNVEDPMINKLFSREILDKLATYK